MNLRALRVAIAPMEQIRVAPTYRDEWRIDHTPVDPRLSFWEWLKTVPLQTKLEDLAFKFLQKHGKISKHRIKEEQMMTATYKETVIDLNKIIPELIEYRERGYARSGQPPNLLIVGMDVERAIHIQSLRDFFPYQYEGRPSDFITQRLLDMQLVVTPELKGYLAVHVPGLGSR